MFCYFFSRFARRWANFNRVERVLDGSSLFGALGRCAENMSVFVIIEFDDYWGWLGTGRYFFLFSAVRGTFFASGGCPVSIVARFGVANADVE